MNVLRQSLERDGLVIRPQQPTVGRVLPAGLTADGRRQLAVASAAVRGVEDRMKSGLSDQERSSSGAMLARCVSSLRDAER